MTNEKSNIENIIDQINSINAKRAAFFLVLGFACYHGLLHLRYGSDSCRWLLSDGRYKANQEWQPYGCMLHRYSQMLLRGKPLLRVLYSMMAIQLYIAFVQHLQRDYTDGANAETNLTYTDHKLRLTIEYIWSPYLSAHMVKMFREWHAVTEMPSVVIVGCGLWSIQKSNASFNTIQEYNVNLTRLVQPINKLHEHRTRVLWSLQQPVNPAKLRVEFQMVTNEQIDLYNKAAIEVRSFADSH
uniref:Uncharacterized protein n=1 Tax=Photinus pyralis TaxID=7054 RepID=A0A1Y1N3Y2_PHOPY